MVEVDEGKASSRGFFREMPAVGLNTKMGYRGKGFEDRRELRHGDIRVLEAKVDVREGRSGELNVRTNGLTGGIGPSLQRD